MSVYTDGFKEGLQLDPTLTVSEWADDNRMLSPKASSEPGRWRTDRTPYLREIMDVLSVYNPTRRVVFKKSAQIGGTECGNNWLGYIIHHAPAPILFVQPTVDVARKVSKQRIAPMLDETPALSKLVLPSKTRDSGNTLFMKEFRGGVLMMTGANSASGLRSMPIRFLFLDEVDGYPGDVDGEGDPIDLAEKRTTTFARRKILLVSTPTVAGESKIEAEYERSDRRLYHVPCPHCKTMQPLRWQGMEDDSKGDDAKVYRLSWINTERTKAGYLCKGCGVYITENYKTAMLAAGKWVPRSEGDGHTRGYSLNSLYSPVGWKSWAEILMEQAKCGKDPTKIKTFVNTTLGETYVEDYSKRIDAEGLAARAEKYDLLTVPEKGLVLTAGVDVQVDRIEAVTRAWGEGEESWLVNRSVIYGDPTRADVWKQLLLLLLTPLKHENGSLMTIAASAVDTGYLANEVYAFCRQHRRKHVLAVKGQSVLGKIAIGHPTKQDINSRGQTIKHGVMLWPVGSDTIKTTMHARLNTEDSEGPGVYHWPIGLPVDYWKQLTAERQVTKTTNGHATRVWVKDDGVANEALDCEVYAYAALQYLYTRHHRETFFSQMKKKLDAKALSSAALATASPEVPVVSPEVTPSLSRGKLSLSDWGRR
jgi:phage terminase large subunit GpA-like protein